MIKKIVLTFFHLQKLFGIFSINKSFLYKLHIIIRLYLINMQCSAILYLGIGLEL
jgi:hypothetical protein